MVLVTRFWLALAIVRQTAAQVAQARVERTADGFPVDRSYCDSSNPACTLGLPELVGVYPILSETPFTQVSLFDEREYDEANHAIPPVPDDIDFSGKLRPGREAYVAPETYVQGFTTFFTGLAATVRVSEYGVFDPANLSVSLGTTVTWVLETYEAVSIVSAAAELSYERAEPGSNVTSVATRRYAEGELFNSGVISKLSHPHGFSHTFTEGEGFLVYKNTKAADAAVSLMPPLDVVEVVANVRVQAMSCANFETCTVCLLYTQCIWCSGNATCIERDPETNLPLDDEVVIEAMPNDEVDADGERVRKYDHLKWYSPARSIFGFDWYPWPSQRANPRPVKDRTEIPLEVGLLATPTESAQCSAYLDMSVGATACPDYRQPPMRNRVHGAESATRPHHQSVLNCYQYVKERWGRDDDAAPTVFASDEDDADATAGGAASAFDAQGATDGDDSAGGGGEEEEDDGVGDGLSGNATVGNASANGSNASSATSTREPIAGDGMAAPSAGEEGQEASVEGGEEGEARSRRLTEFLSQEEICAMEWHELTQADVISCVPDKQRRLLTARERNYDNALDLLLERLVEESGHRCNTTHGCDVSGTEPRGRCLNHTGGQIIGWDQNGTCTCHPWFTTDTCALPDLSGDNCVVGEGILRRTLSDEACSTLRVGLYMCGEVEALDNLPAACVEQRLSALQCLEAGHLRTAASYAGRAYIENLLGHPEDGMAMSLCAKCMSIDGGTIRPETATRTCTSEMKAACQRGEDSLGGQRLCNLCHEDQLGSVEQGRGYIKGCSYFRGTCTGSVEKRIRGIVPPNMDIVGPNDYGGLRYCKRPEPFDTQQHYYTEADIMQPGQSCLDYKAVFTNWDYTYQKDHEDTVKDQYGLACADPSDSKTCPKARLCKSADLCHVDWPDWTNNDLLDQRWGLDVADYLNPGDVETFNWPYVTPQYLAKYLRNIDWSVVDDSDRRRLAARKRERVYEREAQGPAAAAADEGDRAPEEPVDFKWGLAASAPPQTFSGARGRTRVWRASPD